MRPRPRLLAGFLVALGAVAGAAGGGARAAGEAARLADLLAREWEVRLAENPLFATSVGRHEWNDRLPRMRPADEERRTALARGFLDELAAIDRAALGEVDRVSYDMFRTQLEQQVADFRFGAYQVPINADSGFHMAFARLPEEVPLATPRDYENYIARLRAFPAYVEDHIEAMRRGLERGMTVPRITLEGYEATIAAHVVDDPQASELWPPFASFPPGVPVEERERLRTAGAAAIREAVIPGYRRFLAFMHDDYLPGARQTIAAADLPDGRAYYEHLVRSYTTLDLAPAQIHATGLAEVARIRGEMLAVLERVGFQGDLAAFLEFLRRDPRFYAETPEQLLKEAAWIAKRMDAKLPSLFRTLPRLPYGVEAVPASIAPKYTGGRYVGAPLGGTQAGKYWVNTYNLASRPLYVLEALTLHEAVPGHHLQIALAQELENLPPFRRFSYLPAFGEGWGLYSEWLGKEAGFYRDPYSEFGRLTYEMWRACRLVVDTGLHALGWTRQQALDTLAGSTALSLHEVRTETDRYISWPGQALAYKLGELKIQELRRRAERELGTRFDVRDFHDAVLLAGSVPLPVLEDRVAAYIAARRP